jgi:hypothetical protein
MNLVDLADDELIVLFQRVDHKTKLNLMLTCKRFENVIGSYLQLFGKFVLEVRKEHLESPDRVETLTQMRRHFGRIKIHGHDLRLDTEAYNLFFQLLTKIGSKVVELVISSGQFCFVSLVNLLKLTPNIAKLEVLEMDITPRSDFKYQMKLEKLRRFEFCWSSNIEVFEKILKPNSLYEIKIGHPREPESDVPADYWTVIPRILSKQEKLVSLELDHCRITNFPDSPEVWALKNLLKLSLQSLTFPTPKDFENFTKFIKSLDKLTELSLKELDFDEIYCIMESDNEDESDYDENPHDTTEILAHLLFLPTLTKLTFYCFYWQQTKKFLKLKMQNPSVEELKMYFITNGYGKYMKIFPNVRKATIYFSHESDESEKEFGDYIYYDKFPNENYTPINSWTLLEELEVYQTNRMLEQINLKTLRCFKTWDDYLMEPESWLKFCLNHPQLERLECGDHGFKSLPIVVENLPNLKTLILKTVVTQYTTKYSEEEAIEMIAEKCDNLDYLEICLKMKAETAVAILKEKLLGLRGFVKQIDERYKISNVVGL